MKPRILRSFFDGSILVARADAVGAAGVSVTERKGGVLARMAAASRTVSCATPRAVTAAEFRASMASEIALTTAEALGDKAVTVSRDATF